MLFQDIVKEFYETIRKVDLSQKENYGKIVLSNIHSLWRAYRGDLLMISQLLAPLYG